MKSIEVQITLYDDGEVEMDAFDRLDRKLPWIEVGRSDASATCEIGRLIMGAFEHAVEDGELEDA